MLAGGVLLTQPGCTTLLTAGGLQEAFQDVSDIPAVASYDTASDTEAIDGDESSATAEPKPTGPTAAEDALDTALERLAAAGRYWPPARATVPHRRLGGVGVWPGALPSSRQAGD